MLTAFSRTELLLGKERMVSLSNARVIVFGIGGVGSYTVEALARSGVGAIDIVDDDRVCLTNINRQLYALRSTVGRYKVEVAAERIRDINPDCTVTAHRTFFLPEVSDQFDFSAYSYVVDCIDTVTGKVQLVAQAKAAGVPVISCMGAGNKLDPTRLEVADISETSVCPLARAMRKALKKRGIEHLKVIYSKEPPVPLQQNEELSCKSHCICPPGTRRTCAARNQVPGSISFVPSVAGLIMAGEVIKELSGLIPNGGFF